MAVKTVLLTRPAPRSDFFANELIAQFGDQITCVNSPLLKIKPTGGVPDFTGMQAMLFSSPNGVRSLSNMIQTKPTIPCLCVGDKTAIEARSLGCDAFSAKGGAGELVQLTTSVLSPENGPILYIRGQTVAGCMAKTLSEKGFTVVEHIIYEQTPVGLSKEARDLFAQQKVDILPIFSPMTAKLLAAEIRANPDWALDEIDMICLSANVRTQIDGLRFKSVTTVDAPTSDVVTTAIAALLRR